MNKKDINQLALAFGGVLLLLVLMALAPVYVISDDVAERHFVWNAPQKPASQRYDLLSPEVIQVMSQDPVKKRILDEMKNQPKEVAVESNYLGPLFGHGFNFIGYLAMLALLGWLGFAGFKGYETYVTKRQEKLEKEKKKALPMRVSRVSMRRRY